MGVASSNAADPGVDGESPEQLRLRAAVERALVAAKPTEAKMPELQLCAELLSGCEGCEPIATALAELAEQPERLSDLGSYARAQLRAHRRVTAVYSEPVLEGLQMKCDEFDGIHTLRAARVHPAVWNFRQAKNGLPIYGVGQCHLDGLVYLARHLRQCGHMRVSCFNMREEPIVFLNGTACAPRVEGKLSENVDYLCSIEGHELDAMESRLRDDCLQASKRSTDGLPVWFEVDGSNSQKMLHVYPEQSLPVRAAYEHVNEQEGAATVRYVRVPIADETAPEEQDFDQLVAEINPELALLTPSNDGGTALVFNCHMGRGRTTTGMVCASIMLRVASGWRPKVGSSPTSLPDPMASGRDLKRGAFSAILQLLSQLDNVGRRDGAGSGRGAGVDATDGVAGAGLGVRSKILVDLCADECDEVTHLVEAPSQCLQKAAAAAELERSGGKSQRQKKQVPVKGPAESSGTAAFWRQRGVRYLERYAYMLLFAGYVQLHLHGGFRLTFSEWMRKHWAFKRTMRDLALS